MAGWALDQILVMLHPFMPFVTEELWQPRRAALRTDRGQMARARRRSGSRAKAEIEWLIGLTFSVRGAKNELGIAPGARLEAFLAERARPPARLSTATPGPSSGWRGFRRSAANRRPPARQCRCPRARTSWSSRSRGSSTSKPKGRLGKAREASLKERDSLGKRLENPAFVEKARPEAVEKARADHAHHAAEAERLTAALARLG